MTDWSEVAWIDREVITKLKLDQMQNNTLYAQEYPVKRFFSLPYTATSGVDQASQGNGVGKVMLKIDDTHYATGTTQGTLGDDGNYYGQPTVWSRPGENTMQGFRNVDVSLLSGFYELKIVLEGGDGNELQYHTELVDRWLYIDLNTTYISVFGEFWLYYYDDYFSTKGWYAKIYNMIVWTHGTDNPDFD